MAYSSKISSHNSQRTFPIKLTVTNLRMSVLQPFLPLFLFPRFPVIINPVPRERGKVRVNDPKNPTVSSVPSSKKEEKKNDRSQSTERAVDKFSSRNLKRGSLSLRREGGLERRRGRKKKEKYMGRDKRRGIGCKQGRKLRGIENREEGEEEAFESSF